MSLFRACAWLAAALILASVGDGWAQSQPPQAPPAQTQPPQSQPATQPPQPQPVIRPQSTPVTQPQPEQAQPKKRRQGRQKRASRTSTRRPPSPATATFEENRASRVAGPTQQDLKFTANVLIGYDDNLTAGLGTGSGMVPGPMASGSTGFLDGTLSYSRGNTLRSVQVDAIGNLRTYPGNLDQPAPGGIANVGARTTLGRDMTLRVSERVGYEPLFSVFSPTASGGLLPSGTGQAVPATGLFEQRSLNSSTSVSIDRQWSRRDWTSLSYSYRLEHFTEGTYGDNHSQNVQAEYRRGLARGVRARASYRFVDLNYTDYNGGGLPTRENWIEGGAEIDPQVSSSHPLTLSLNAGATYIESVNSVSRKPYDAWVPVGSVRANFGLSPSWSVDGGYERNFSLFAGVTNDVYTTGTAYVSTGGLLTTRTDLRVGGTYSNWRTPLASGVDETMIVYGASLQMRVSLTAGAAAFGGYYYYHHRYSNPAALPMGFPAQYDRNAVRVGVTVWLPRRGPTSQPPMTPR